MIDEHDLNLVFGAGHGDDPRSRATASMQRFVRSQVQLAPYSASAKGHVLTALEALRAFGFETLLKAMREGSAPLIWRMDEPAQTLRERRLALNISSEKLARSAGLTRQQIDAAETPKRVSPIRDLETIAQHLALDETTLGYTPNAGADNQLGVRLRELKNARDEVRFTDGIVLKLSEAAWVIAKQAYLAKLLDEAPFRALGPDPNFTPPAWEQGFRLAAETRRALNIGADEPIPSVRVLLEERLHVPLIQQDLGQKFAGATLANGDVRGIVVNESGANRNVWIRRMTLCHELGHLLWDPDQALNRLKVDTYEEMQADFRQRRDPVEIRANAFAVAFLAPRSSVEAVFRQATGDVDALITLSNTYGISFTAARNHAANILHREVDDMSGAYPTPNQDWEVRENLTVDFFPIGTTPISRRGHFAHLAARALLDNKISADTAGSLLRTTAETASQRAASIADFVR